MRGRRIRFFPRISICSRIAAGACWSIMPPHSRPKLRRAKCRRLSCTDAALSRAVVAPGRPSADDLSVTRAEAPPAALPARTLADPGRGFHRSRLDSRERRRRAAPGVVSWPRGGSGSHYAAALMRAVARRHWHGVVVHFRGCSGEPNLLPRAYHSGDADEIGWILQRLRALDHARLLFAAGVSLGGNALLKWLGRERERARAVIDAAAAISAPMDLMTAGDLLGSGFNRLYGWHFLKTLKPKSLAKLKRFPGLYDGK